MMLSRGCEFLVADDDSEVLEGVSGHVTIVCRFPSKEAAKAWYESDEYQHVKHLRTDNSEGFLIVCDQFKMPHAGAH